MTMPKLSLGRDSKRPVFERRDSRVANRVNLAFLCREIEKKKEESLWQK